MGNIDGDDEGGDSATATPSTPLPETSAPVRRGGPGTAGNKRTGNSEIPDSPEASNAANRRAEAAAAAARERNRYRHHLNGICRLLWHGSWVQTAYDRTVCEGVNAKSRALELSKRARARGAGELANAKPALTVAEEGEWEQLRSVICRVVRKVADEHVDHPQARQILFSLLGHQFAEKFFPEMPQQPHVIEEPYMATGMRMALTKELNEMIVERTLELAEAEGLLKWDQGQASGEEEKTRFAYKDSKAKLYQDFVERIYESSINDEVDNLCGRVDELDARWREERETVDDEDEEEETPNITEETKAEINSLRTQVRRELIGQGIASILHGDGLSMDELNVGSWTLGQERLEEEGMSSSSPAKAGEGQEGAPASVARSAVPLGSTKVHSTPVIFNRSTSSRTNLDPAEMVEAKEIAKRERLRALRRETKVASCDVRAEVGRYLVTERERWKGSLREEHAELMRRLRGRCIPHSIRRFLWKQKLFERRMYEEIAATTKKNLSTKDGMGDPFTSSINNLLMRIVGEAYRSRLWHMYEDSALRLEDTDGRKALAARAQLLKQRASGRIPNRYSSKDLRRLSQAKRAAATGLSSTGTTRSILSMYIHGNTAQESAMGVKGGELPERTVNILNQYFLYSGAHHTCHPYLILPLLLVFANESYGWLAGIADGEGAEMVSSKTSPRGLGASIGTLRNSSGNSTVKSPRGAGKGGDAAGAAIEAANSIERVIDRTAAIVSLLKVGLEQHFPLSRAKENTDLIWERLRKRDAELHKHIDGIFDARAKRYQRDRRKLNSGDGPLYPAQLFLEWCEVCLVGYLRQEALLFVWDQCFLLGWKETFPILCTDVVQLCRKDLLEAGSVPELMRSISLDAEKISTGQLREIFSAREKGEAIDANWVDEAVLRRQEKRRQGRNQRIKDLLKTTTPVHGMGDGDDDDDFIVELQERCELGCVMGNADAVEDALDAGIDSNYVNADGLSMLFLASERGHTSVVRLLLERGADPFIGNSVVHATCLHGACAGGARTFGRVPGSGETSSAGEDEEGQAAAQKYKTAKEQLLPQFAKLDKTAPLRLFQKLANGAYFARKGTTIDHISCIVELFLSGAADDDRSLLKKTTKRWIIDPEPIRVAPTSTAFHVAALVSGMDGSLMAGHSGVTSLLLAFATRAGRAQELLDLQVEDPTPAQVAIDALKGEFSSASLRIATSVRELCAEGNNKKLKDKLEDVKEETSLRWILHAISPTALQGKGQFAKARHMDKAGHVGKKKKKKKKKEGVEVVELFPFATPLALACLSGNLKCAKTMVKAGANVRAGLPGPITPVMCALFGLAERLARDAGAGLGKEGGTDDNENGGKEEAKKGEKEPGRDYEADFEKIKIGKAEKYEQIIRLLLDKDNETQKGERDNDKMMHAVLGIGVAHVAAMCKALANAVDGKEEELSGTKEFLQWLLDEAFQGHANKKDVLGRNPQNFEAEVLKAYTEEAQEEEDDELNMDEDDEEDYSIKDQDGGKTSSLVPSKITVGRGSGERQELFVPEFYPGVDGVSSVAEMIFRHGDNKDAIESLREDDEEEEVVVNNLIAKVLARVVKRAGLEGLADDRDVATKTVKIKGKEGPMFLRLTALQKGDPVEWAKERARLGLERIGRKAEEDKVQKIAEALIKFSTKKTGWNDDDSGGGEGDDGEKRKAKGNGDEEERKQEEDERKNKEKEEAERKEQEEKEEAERKKKEEEARRKKEEDAKRKEEEEAAKRKEEEEERKRKEEEEERKRKEEEAKRKKEEEEKKKANKGFFGSLFG